MHSHWSENANPSGNRTDLAEWTQKLRRRNQRYLDCLKESGDPLDARSKILATILDCVPDGLVVFDAKLTSVLVNAAAGKLAGWAKEELTRDELHRHYQVFLDEDLTPLPYDQEPGTIALREIRPCEKQVYVVSEHLPPPGRWIRINAAPVLDNRGTPIGTVSVFTDITEQLRLQRQKDCLAALITHDIKNHLAAEEMFFEILGQAGAERFEDDSLKMLDELRKSSENFRGIAQSLLEMFRSSFLADHQYAQEFQLEPLIEAVVKLSSLECEQGRVRIAVGFGEPSPKIRGLPGVIQHVIYNLVQNAIKASHPDSVVTVLLSSKPGKAIIQVKDTGVGMSPDVVAELFDPQRVSRHTLTTGLGSEFGLYVSSVLIEGQGGTIRCSSQPQKGSTFTVTIPAVLLG